MKDNVDDEVAKAKVQETWHKPSLHITVSSDQPWHPHPKFLKSLQLSSQEKVCIQFRVLYDGVNHQSDEDYELRQAHEENE